MAENNFSIPGMVPFGTMLDAVDFMRRAWSGLNLPSHLGPTIDVDEIDKRIGDLKTVEQWLTVNVGLVQSTIQGLQIQRGSVAAIKAFSEAAGARGGEASEAMAAALAAGAQVAQQAAQQAMNTFLARPGTGDAAAASDAAASAHAAPPDMRGGAPSTSTRRSAASPSGSSQGGTRASAGSPTEAATQYRPGYSGDGEDGDEMPVAYGLPDADVPVSGAAPAAGTAGEPPARARGTKKADASSRRSGAGDKSARTAAGSVQDASPVAGAWWNLLQNQFQQIAQAALSGATGIERAGAELGDSAAGPSAPSRPSKSKARNARASPASGETPPAPAARAKRNATRRTSTGRSRGNRS